MTAAVLNAPGDITVEQVPVPEPSAGEVLLEVSVCGVCGSDIDRMLRKGAHRLPLICGHEFSGRVVAVGSGVDDNAIGKLYTVPPMIPCFRCEECKRGRFSLCQDYDYFGSRRDGAYAQFVTVPTSNLMPVPEHIDPRAAAMVDPAAIAFHGLRHTPLTLGSRVAVVGAGPIGLFAIQWARLAGAAEVVSIDLTPEKATMALEAGATSAVASLDAVMDLRGNGFDVVFESAGAPSAVDAAVALLARHGVATFVGIPNAPITLADKTFSRLMRLEARMQGSWNSFVAPFPGEAWTESVRQLASGGLRWEFMVTHQLSLHELPAMMTKLGERSVFSSKVLFFPHGL